jgi:hypothetical protein
MVAFAIEPGDDRRFYAYVLKHNGTPIWVGLGSGSRHEIRSHCARTAKPAAKREYILKHLDEIVFADLPWEEAAEKESALQTVHRRAVADPRERSARPTRRKGRTFRRPRDGTATALRRRAIPDQTNRWRRSKWLM